jgi:hypothetical protein
MKFRLNDRSLIRVSGTDTKSFLQGQLSNDIDAIKSSQIQINAYCQHQGKVIAILWVVNSGNEYLISLPSDLLDIVRSRLEMFVMMSEVEISDLTATTPHFGVIGEDLKGSFRLNDRQSIFIGEMPADDIVEIDDNEWQRVCIETGIPEVYLSTTEKFVPQMLNLDIDEIGVSFSKGCYPGQEVVARLHYLGKAKRRMFKFKGPDICVGDELVVDDSSSLRASGVVNRVALSGDEYLCLATLENAHKDDKIRLNDGTKIVRIVDE